MKWGKLIYPGHITGSTILLSGGYANCNGLVLLGENRTGLSHYVFRSGDHRVENAPRKYVTTMLQALGKGELESIIIGGDPDHFRLLHRLMRKKGIPIVGSYLDK